MEVPVQTYRKETLVVRAAALKDEPLVTQVVSLVRVACSISKM